MAEELGMNEDANKYEAEAERMAKNLFDNVEGLIGMYQYE